MNISQEKMTFLSANYGLSPAQVEAFAAAYQQAYYQMAGEIECSWQEMGWWPSNEDDAMIETLCDADRLAPYIDDYMDWCFDFVYKQELVYDLQDKEPPGHLQEYLLSTGMTWWLATQTPR